MRTRSPYVAGAFYPGSAAACRRQIEECLAAPLPDLPGGMSIVGAMVPHAGWTFSGPTAALAYKAVRAERSPDAFILLGASHNPTVRRATLMSAGAWATPLGRVELDTELAQAVLEATQVPLLDDAGAHDMEHSIEVQVPFVQYLFPEAQIVPIIVPPSSDSPAVGEAVAAAIGRTGRDAVVVGSADLTHYGSRFGITGHGLGTEANRWVKEVNDRRMVDLVLGQQAGAIVAEAAQHHNSCGGGSLAALVAAATALGATDATLLRQTTSFEVLPDARGDTIVGYASAVFLVKVT